MHAIIRTALVLLLSFFVLAPLGVAPGAAAQEAATNEEIVHRAFDQVFSRGEMDQIDDLFAPDFVLHTSVDPARDVQGLEGLAGFVTGVRTAFPDITYTVDEMISEGETVVARWSNRATHQGDFLGIPPTGKAIAIGGGDMFRLDDGKLTEAWSIADNLGLLIQLGVIPGGEQMGTATPGPMAGDAIAVATPESATAARALMADFWTAYNAGDADTILGRIFSPDFANHTPAPGFPATGEGLVQTMQFFAAGFPDQQATVEEIVVEGDLVAARVTVTGTHEGTAYGVPATGRHVAYGGLTIVRVANGKMVENWGFYDQVGILTQIGAMGGAPAATPAA